MTDILYHRPAPSASFGFRCIALPVSGLRAVPAIAATVGSTLVAVPGAISRAFALACVDPFAGQSQKCFGENPEDF